MAKKSKKPTKKAMAKANKGEAMMHKMPGGMMMSNAEMKKMMGKKKMVKKGY